MDLNAFSRLAEDVTGKIAVRGLDKDLALHLHITLPPTAESAA
jgi:hypothetical protein